MTTTNQRTPPQRPDDWTYRRIQELERRVNQLENLNNPTIPTYDWNHPPDDPIEGQVALFVNAPDTNAGTEVAGADGRSVGTSGLTDFHWIVSGDTPDWFGYFGGDDRNPEVKVDGVYTVFAESDAAGITAGKKGFFTVTIPTFVEPLEAIIPLDYLRGFTFAATMHLSANQFFAATISHDNSSSLTFYFHWKIQKLI